MIDPAKTCVIFNPASGRGRALRGIERYRQSANLNHDFRPTTAPGDAETIAERAVQDGFGKIVAAGGDGTVHEVANGILKASNPEVVFSVWPFGSANDYAHALGVDGDPTQPTVIQEVDVGQIKAANGRHRYFVNGLGIGFNGDVTVEARRIKWVRGVLLYSLAVFKAMIWHFKKPKTTLQFDDKTRTAPTLALTLNLGQREGNFPLTPKADLSDGLFDYMHAGPVSRWDILRNFPNMLRGTLPADHPRMWLGQCRRLEAKCETPMRIHLDGEFFCHPEDGVRKVIVELLPARLRVERAATTG